MTSPILLFPWNLRGNRETALSRWIGRSLVLVIPDGSSIHRQITPPMIGVALWVGPGAEGHFANLKISR